LTNQLN